MNASSWSRVTELLEQASELDGAARADFLDEQCAGDAELRRQVELLLEADSKARSFLAAPEQHPLRMAIDALAGSAPESGTRIRGYTLVRRIASGGMGSVYEATQEKPRRKVALKLVHTFASTHATRERFASEAEILGRLRHPCIAQVYEAGADAEGRAFLAMEFVENARHLNQWVREHELGARAIATLFLDVCAGVAHGHQKGVIHRDLKPANVLVDASGQVKVIDFGIARVLDERSVELTRTGDIIGTLLYMSPEQLDGDARAIDVRSDVYALGALLYELFAGRPPHELHGLSLTEAARVLRDVPPRPLRALDPGLDPELEWIVGKALDKDRERRYATVNELAADLRRYLQNEPVLASPPSTAYRIRKFVRRHRFGVATGASFLVLLVGGLIAALLARDHAIDLSERALSAETAAGERARALALELETNRAILDLQTTWLRAPTLETKGRDAHLADALDEARRALDQRAELEPRVEVELRAALAYAYHSLNLWGEFDEQMSKVRSLARAHGGFDPSKMEDLERRSCAADPLLGRKDQALARARELQAEALRRDGPSSASYGRWSLTLSDVLFFCYRFAEAEEAVRVGIGVLERLQPVDERAVQEARLCLCRSLRMQGKLEDSLREAESLSRAAAQHWPAEHSFLRLLQQELAAAKSASGDDAGASAILESLLAEFERRYGPDSEAALAVACDLALSLSNAGSCERALTLAARAAEGTLRLRGEENELSELRSIRLGTVLGRCGEADRGIEVLEKVRASRARRFGPDAPETLEVESLLGHALSSSGRLEDGLAVLSKAHRGYRTVYGPSSVKTLDCANNLALTLSSLGRDDEALPLLEDLLEENLRTLDALDPDVLISIGNLANTLQYAGRIDDAECWYRELLARSEKRYGSADPRTWTFVTGFIVNLLGRKRAAEAVAFVARALPPLLADPQASAEVNARLQCLLGRAARDSGSIELARASFQDAMQLAIERIPMDSIGFARIEEAYGSFVALDGRLEEAIAVCETALEHGAEAPELVTRLSLDLAELRSKLADQRGSSGSEATATEPRK